jgi:guanosine-3',5'-bis(diphosphate) 3'-pyrophosphohydrolase
MDRADFFAVVSGYTGIELASVELAYRLAEAAHEKAYRDSGEPFFTHPCAVAISLIEHGYAETGHIATALLHDVPEDTDAPPNLILNLFGREMLASLERLSRYKLSFDPAMERFIVPRRKKSLEAYFQGLAAGSDKDKLVKCADRLHNSETYAALEAHRRARKILETERFVIPLAATVPGNPYLPELEAAVAKLKMR